MQSNLDGILALLRRLVEKCGLVYCPGVAPIELLTVLLHSLAEGDVPTKLASPSDTGAGKPLTNPPSVRLSLDVGCGISSNTGTKHSSPRLTINGF